MKRTWKQIGSLFLSVCMVMTMLPTVAFAETNTKDSGAGLGTSSEITAFAALAADIAVQTVDSGTAEDELKLPKTLDATVTKTVTTTTGSAVAATVSGNDTATDSEAQKQEPQEEIRTEKITEDTTVAVSGWTSDPAYSPEYDAEGNNTYVFTPALELPDGVTLAEGVTAPQIAVTVEEAAIPPIPAAPVLARSAGIQLVSVSGDGWTLGDDGLLTIISDTGMTGWTAAVNADYTLRGSVTALTIGEAVTGIPVGAFNVYNYLATVTFDGTPTVTTIGSDAFSHCHLTAFTVPASVTSISPNAFANTSIAAFTVAGGNAYKASAEGALLTYDEATLHTFPCGKTGEYTVENGITAIGKGAFCGTQLSTVVIPAAVASIGAEAFVGSGSLTAVVFEGNTLPATVGGSIFQYSYELASIYVPTGKVNDYKQATGLTAYADKIKAAPGQNPSVTDADALKAALEYALPQTITVTEDFTLNTDKVTMGASHTLVIGSGKTLTISGDKGININGKTLTMNGGGTVTVANTTKNGIWGGGGTGGTSGGTLNLAGVTVNLENTGNNGGLFNMDINVDNGAAINLNSSTAGGQIQLGNGRTLTINAGGEVNVNYFWSSGVRNAGGTVHLNGGTLHVGVGSGQNWGINNTGGGLLKVTSGTLDTDNGSAIYLTEGSKVENMGGKFKDRGMPFTASGQVQVGERDAQASASGLTEGTYYYNGSLFEKHGITVATQPEDVTVTQGAITGSLTALAEASNGSTVGYQWWRYNEATGGPDSIPEATNPSFTIPTDLTAGTYGFGCRLTAEGCDDWSTRGVTVTVNPAGDSTVTGTIKGSDTGSGIAGASLKLKGQDGGTVAITTTGPTGSYSFANILPGTYSIEASANFYDTGALSNVVISGADITGQDLTLIRQDYYGAYGLVVGDVMVTADNKDNITGIGITGTISYHPATKTLTLKNATIGFARFSSIVSDEDLTVKLEGNSVLGVKWSDYQQSQIGVGISGKTRITLTGDGNLTIYNTDSGIQAKNITIDMGGTLTIDELGNSGRACTLKANGGAITINKGTLNLKSKLSNGLYGNSIVINGGNITAYSEDGNNAGLFAFNRAPSFGRDYWYKVYAGNNEASAVDITAPNSRTYTNSNYVKITQVPEGTGLRGTGSDNGDSDNGGDSGGSSGGSTGSTTTVTAPGKTPNQPVTAAAPVTATAGQNGSASASIPEKSVTDAIAKAQADAKAQGKTANGTTVALNVTMPKGATSLTANLTRNSLNSLVSAGVTSLELNGSPVAVSFDTKALAEIQKQSSGNISITIVPNAKLSASAKGIIGTRPVYDLTVSYTKDGKNATVTSFGGGMATVSVPYTPAKGEAVGGLYAVYVDAKGNATCIAGSAYDANSGCVMFTTTHFSLYGIGYTAPSAKFTDITNHWAKESIDYVVGRGLLSGTTETTFAPDTAMTRGMLVTALGRLASVDTKAYTTNSFTDVTADSAFRPYIEWAYKKGIVQGTGNGKFEPDRAITREEIAVIFANFAKATGYTLPVTRTATIYADASSIGEAYKTAVTAMQQAGIMMGGSGNKFNPKSSATRAEVSSMLHRYIKLTIDPATAQGWALNDAGQYLYYKDGKALTGTQTIGSAKYFFNTDGTLKTGWVKDDAGNWRFYSGNIMLVGFWDLGANGNNKTYYFNKDGIMVAGKWLQIDGKWYYFNADGSLAKSTKIDGYEVDENGVRKMK